MTISETGRFTLDKGLDTPTRKASSFFSTCDGWLIPEFVRGETLLNVGLLGTEVTNEDEKWFHGMSIQIKIRKFRGERKKVLGISYPSNGTLAPDLILVFSYVLFLSPFPVIVVIVLHHLILSSLDQSPEVLIPLCILSCDFWGNEGAHKSHHASLNVSFDIH